MRKRAGVGVAAVLALAVAGLAAQARPPSPRVLASETSGFILVATYPHDEEAFTQGLDFDRGQFYETTGTGPASLRLVELATGEVQRQVELSDKHFGEGMTVLGRRLWWITWKTGKAFVYDPRDFDRLDTFQYKGEGWGLTHNRRRLVMSDGTDRIVFRDPETFRIKRKIFVTDEGTPVTRINELEWVEGEIFANIWQEDVIARIDPSNGNVLGWIDVSELKQAESEGDVTNGIAYMSSQDRLFVTGKYWSRVYEIQPTE